MSEDSQFSMAGRPKISETWIHPKIPGCTNFREQINLNKGFGWISSENEGKTGRPINSPTDEPSPCTRPAQFNGQKVVHSSAAVSQQITSNPLTSNSTVQQFSNHKMDIYQKIQKRFYGKKKSDPCKDNKSKPKSKKKKEEVPECADKGARKPPKKECPPIVKSEGKCCRVKMPGCKKSCKFHRKYCCMKTTRKKCHRKRTPKPSFSECYDVDVKVHPECDCGAKQSPCEHDKRKPVKPKKTKTCK